MTKKMKVEIGQELLDLLTKQLGNRKLALRELEKGFPGPVSIKIVKNPK